MTDMIFSYLGKLGSGGLLIAVFIEAMGIPFPGGLMLMFAGFLISQKNLSFITAFGASVIGFTAGASTAFYLGKNIGETVFERYGRYLRFKPQTLRKAQQWMNRSSAIFILLGRFVPMVSNLTPYLAGIGNLSWGYFLFYNTIFVTVWSTAHIAIGMFLGHNWKQFAAANQYKIPLAVLGIVIIYYFIKYIMYRHKNILNL
ncbi:MAG: DedA family protein [Clostridiales bacterium]|nr:DedA family protein [Clostridiales bacterium]MCF8021649.1 DedA family protein [Clostridiales bacterium]